LFTKLENEHDCLVVAFRDGRGAIILTPRLILRVFVVAIFFSVFLGFLLNHKKSSQWTRGEFKNPAQKPGLSAESDTRH
jgi:hypothetical protein